MATVSSAGGRPPRPPRVTETRITAKSAKHLHRTYAPKQKWRPRRFASLVMRSTNPPPGSRRVGAAKIGLGQVLDEQLFSGPSAMWTSLVPGHGNDARQPTPRGCTADTNDPAAELVHQQRWDGRRGPGP